MIFETTGDSEQSMPTSAAVSMLATAQEPSYVQRFQMTLDRLGKVLPMFYEMNREALYAVYCAGFADYCGVQVQSTHFNAKVSDALFSRAVSQYAESLGMSDEQLTAAVNKALAEEMSHAN